MRKRRESSGVLCVKRIPMRLKRKFYKNVVRHVSVYVVWFGVSGGQENRTECCGNENAQMNVSGETRGEII